MIPNSDLENPEVPLCLVFLSMILRRILMTGALLYISVVWTPKSVLTRYGTTPYCINFGKSFHYTTGFLCIDGTII